MAEGRVELKYVLSEAECAALVKDAAKHAKPDPHADLLPNGGRGYIVSSIYLDDERLSGYAERLENAYVRNRIRVRTYGHAGDGAPVFLEAKRKLTQRVIKQRVRVDDADSYAERAPEAPWRHGMASLGGVQRSRAQRFDAVVSRLHATARCVVRYEREVFVDGPNRFTLDHNVRCGAVDDLRDLYAPAPIKLLPPGAVVVEIKFDDTAPSWMRALQRDHHLCSEPVSKFGMAMAALYGSVADVQRLRPHGARRVA